MNNNSIKYDTVGFMGLNETSEYYKKVVRYLTFHLILPQNSTEMYFFKKKNSYISLRYWCRKRISFAIKILFNFILCVMTHSTLVAQFDILRNSFPKPVKSSCEKSRGDTRVMQEEN